MVGRVNRDQLLLGRSTPGTWELFDQLMRVEEYKECRKKLKQEIRRVKRDNEMFLTNRIKDNPKLSKTDIEKKRVTKEKLGLTGSLASVVAKLLERILRDGIYSHLEENKFIWDSQHDFVLQIP